MNLAETNEQQFVSFNHVDNFHWFASHPPLRKGDKHKIFQTKAKNANRDRIAEAGGITAKQRKAQEKPSTRKMSNGRVGEWWRREREGVYLALPSRQGVANRGERVGNGNGNGEREGVGLALSSRQGVANIEARVGN